MNDVNFAFRQLLKSPGFPTAILALALGIDANSSARGADFKISEWATDYRFKLTYSDDRKSLSATLTERTGLNDEQFGGVLSP